MKLVHFDFDNQFLFNGFINVLVIENGKYFRQYCTELVSQIHGDEGMFVLSDKEKQLPLNSNAIIMYDYFSFDLTDRKIVNKLYSDLTNIVIDSFNEEYTTLLESFEHLFQKLNSEYDLSIDNDEPSIPAILKAFGVCFESDTLFLERLIAYIEVLRTINKIKLFCFINLKSYLSEDELLLFYDYVIKSDLNVFLLECKTMQRLENEYIVLIDEDLCEVILE